MRKYIVDGHVAVVLTKDYGAGWSTWHRDSQNQAMLFDPAIVDYILKGQYLELDQYIRLKYPNISYYNVNNLGLEWIPEGVEFVILEHDGLETLFIKDKIKWIKA